MATLESAITVFAPQRFPNNYRFLVKSPDSVKLSTTSFSSSIFSHSHNKLHLSSFRTRTPCFALQEVTEATIEDEKIEETETLNIDKKKIAVFNLPWSQSAADIKELFAECGTVTDVKVIKGKDRKGKGYAFVTMDSAEEAQAAVDQFNAREISGRIIRVEFARSLKKPSPSPPPGTPPSPAPIEARFVIYTSNLAWKARSTHLRDIFAENFKAPVSARVVFQTPAGRSAGYGFVSYHTVEEAEAAISALEGKELLGRPLRVKISEKKVKEASNEEGEKQDADAQVEGENQNADAQVEVENQNADAQLEGENQNADTQLEES
ncbi:29 kDa ribonucleoprotein A, chloroplastic [Vicia villosa]|uniref:29 kDa ribonucleoprotein A, chloroplastic n=1 Tax=Vicia villosa TaxID=3911 RepID=UPI00273AAC0B|nr:29 kDa ribonucleoprotein A, chloroplastic [Vicia villosa]